VFTSISDSTSSLSFLEKIFLNKSANPIFCKKSAMLFKERLKIKNIEPKIPIKINATAPIILIPEESVLDIL